MTTYAHELDAWPNYTWDARVDTHLRALRASHAALLRRADATSALQAALTAHTLTLEILASSAIEEEHLAPVLVRRAVDQHLGLAPLTPLSAAVSGPADLTFRACADAAAPLTEQALLAWHATLFPPGAPHAPRQTGTWRDDRDGPMQIVSGHAARIRVHFEAPAAPRVPAEMTTLLTWLRDDPGDELLKAALAHLWFVSVHPFEDGNGRVARALTLRSLVRADGDVPYRAYAAAPALLRQRPAYYLALERAQRTLDVTDWLTWFLDRLGDAITHGHAFINRWDAAHALWTHPDAAGVNDRQRKVLKMLLGEFVGTLHARKYAKLTRCAPDTAETDLAQLVTLGLLRVSGPPARYALAPEFTPRSTP